MSDALPQFPFRTTESEKRILRELLEIARLRPKALPDCAAGASAEEYIASLRAELFPRETALAAARAQLLKPLNAGPLRVHFDQALETAMLTVQAKIRTATEYRAMVERLQKFDFEAWQAYCESERSDAD